MHFMSCRSPFTTALTTHDMLRASLLSYACNYFADAGGGNEDTSALAWLLSTGRCGLSNAYGALSSMLVTIF